MILRPSRKIYYINLNMIVRPKEGTKSWAFITRYFYRKKIYWPFAILGGNWDKIETVPAVYRIRQMTELFIDKIPYKETANYKKLVKEIEKNGHSRYPKTESLQEIDEYFSRLFALYEDIKKNGFKDYKQLGQSRKNEINIRISRDGRLIKSGEGTHRLAMAKILGIKEVPVVVDLIHRSLYTQWKKACPAEYKDPVEYGIELLKQDFKEDHESNDSLN